MLENFLKIAIVFFLRCMKEEIFGPIVCIDTFKTEEEAIEKANDAEYGLCASVWSENVGVIHRVAEALEVGMYSEIFTF